MPAKTIFVPGMYFFGLTRYGPRSLGPLAKIPSPTELQGEKEEAGSNNTSGSSSGTDAVLLRSVRTRLCVAALEPLLALRVPQATVEEFVHVLVRPDDAGILVGLGVGEALQGSRLAAEDAPQRGALLGVAALLDRVALRALCLGSFAPFFTSPSGTSTSGSAIGMAAARSFGARGAGPAREAPDASTGLTTAWARTA
ncbi:unnamed protein product, partial [Prorocentrum cordatum]